MGERGSIPLNAFDLSVFVVYMLVTVVVGFLVAGRHRKTAKGYFLGDRRLPWYVVATSMIAADISSDDLIANAGGPPRGNLAVMTDEHWYGAFDTTVLFVVRLIRGVLPPAGPVLLPAAFALLSMDVPRLRRWRRRMLVRLGRTRAVLRR